MGRRTGAAAAVDGGMSDDEARSWLRRAAIATMPATSEPTSAAAQQRLAARAKVAALSKRVEHEGEPPQRLVEEARAILAGHGLERASRETLDGTFTGGAKF